MAQPVHGVHNEVDDEPVLVGAFARDDMTKYVLGLVAPHHNALHDGAVYSLLRHSSVAFRSLGLFELFPAFQSIGRDVPVIHSDTGNLMHATRVVASFLAEASSHDAKLAP